MEATAVKDPYQKTCKYISCVKSFKAKRLNQEFCCSECKKKANNGKASQLRQLINQVDWQLKLNRKILEAFYLDGKTIVNIDVLQANGFDYLKHTGSRADANGKYTIPEFYNYSLEKTSNNQLKINKLW